MPLQWIEVDADRLASNLRALKSHLGEGARIAPVIKSNAYGHGLSIAARAFAAGGADWLCTHSFVEAERARTLDLGLPILILGPLSEEEITPAVEAGFHLTAYDATRIRELEAAAAARGLKARVHLKLETGTWRQGADADELAACLDILSDSSRLELTGVHSHFANIEDTTDHSYAEEQARRFEAGLAAIREKGLTPAVDHMSCSAASILFPEQHMGLARVGISAYGYWPSPQTRVSARQIGTEELDLAPALNWKVQVAQLKTVPAGSFIGYGCTDKVEVDSRIAVLPVGYADGYDRSFSGKARVLIGGRRCQVRGRVCMNLTMVDVSHLSEVRVGDEAVLLGKQGGEEITAATLADWAGTIHYEILARISGDVERRSVS